MHQAIQATTCLHHAIQAASCLHQAIQAASCSHQNANARLLLRRRARTAWEWPCPCPVYLFIVVPMCAAIVLASKCFAFRTTPLMSPEIQRAWLMANGDGCEFMMDAAGIVRCTTSMLGQDTAASDLFKARDCRILHQTFSAPIY